MDDNPQHAFKREPVIYYDEPETKPAPLGTAGVLAWIKQNLFNTPVDIILTILGSVFTIVVLISFFAWSIQQANWMVITFNFRLFMIGTFELVLEWRIVFVALYVAFMVGWMIFAWLRRLSPMIIGAVATLVIVVFAIPLLSNIFIPEPITRYASGNVAIERGSALEEAQSQLAFIARENEQVVIYFDESLQNDEEIAEMRGFMDIASNTLRNAAIARTDALMERQELNEILGIGTSYTVEITPTEENEQILELVYRDSATGAIIDRQFMLASEYAELVEEREALEEIPEPVSDTYHVNQVAVNLRLLDGDTLEPITEVFTLEPGGPDFRYTLKADGWYVLEKSMVESGEESVAILVTENVRPIYEAAATFRRIPDYYEVLNNFRPQIEGERFAIPIPSLVDVRYRGDHTFQDYIKIWLAPFLNQHNVQVLVIVLLGVVGYVASRLLDRRFSPTSQPRKFASRLAWMMLAAAPILLWIAVNGLVVGEFTSNFIIVLMLGFLVSRTTKLRFSWMLVLCIAAFAALTWLGSATDDGIVIFNLSDPQRWGGFLLSIILTVYAIIIAFPIGIGLALGRRSNLPAIKFVSTAFIELIRGSPFITVLFFFQLMTPYLGLGEIPRTYRALIAAIVFSAAYLAENIRGGLQSLPPGQEEAGQAVGLRGWQIIIFITMPQALRAVIPAIVSQFIGLFKDTTLVSLVGLTDPARYIVVVVSQVEFKSNRNEAIVFVAIIFFIVSYIMSYVSRRIEETGSGAARRV